MRILQAIVIAAVAATPIAMSAQSSIDAYSVSRNGLSGTARFQAMGGAFTALGGDLSSLHQNPAGVGIYRSSEVGFTFDIDAQKATTSAMGIAQKQTHTYADFSNIGYIGSFSIDNETMPYFNVGISYNRSANFNRRYKGYVPSMETSLSNYAAYYAYGLPSSQLLETGNYNPYMQSSADWLSILAYNSYLISNIPGSDSSYQGLFQSTSSGDAGFEVEEKGYIDEYNIDFGGNILNTVYWGLGVGITDLNYIKNAYYGESIDNACVPNSSATDLATGYADYSLYNSKQITGTGFNIKLGFIFKPINEFRIGAAIHTPTWYNMTQNYSADTDYRIGVNGQYEFTPKDHPYNYTDLAQFDWRLRAPWRFSIGAAGVLGGRAIISAEYERVAYDAMSIKTQSALGNYETDQYLETDIKNYFQAGNIFRVGAEFRLAPWISLRAGYSNESSNVKNEAFDGSIDVYSSGTDPSYTFNNKIEHITAGVGFRYQAFYLDLAYIHKKVDSRYYAFSNFDTYVAPQTKLENSNNRFVMSIGYKF